MRHISLYVLTIFILLGVLFIAGCSPAGTISAPISASTPAHATTFSVTATSTLLPFTGKIAFVSYDDMDNHHLIIMNANGSGLIDITPPNSPPKIEFLSWSPDGQYIAFDAWKDEARQIFKIKSNGSNLVQLTFGKNGGSSPSWSPDGKSIMFASSNPDILDSTGVAGAPQIYIMNSNGADTHRLVVKDKPDNTTMTGFYRKDGLITVQEPITRYAVMNYIVNSEGIIQKQFPEFSSDMPIAWSPDGQFVASAPGRNIPGCWGIFVMKFDQSEQECLMDQKNESPIYFGQISWSFDGKYIMFLSNLNGDYDLYLIRPDGSGLTQLTNVPRNEDWAVWWSEP
jgi:TolB protein